MKIIATIGLLFFAYCLLQVLSKLERYSMAEKIIWLVVIGAGGSWCMSAFL